MKKTYCVPAALSNEGRFQERIDKFWSFIENHYEEEWHIQANGDLILTVDAEFIEQVILDNYAEAYFKYGTYNGGRTAEGETFLLHIPTELMGEYIIKGVYDASQRLVSGERTYFFIQGA